MNGSILINKRGFITDKWAVTYLLSSLKGSWQVWWGVRWRDKRGKNRQKVGSWNPKDETFQKEKWRNSTP